MPFIDVKLSESLETEKIESVKTKLGKAIPLLPGKSENYLMVNIEPECHLYFKGSNDVPPNRCYVKFDFCDTWGYDRYLF